MPSWRRVERNGHARADGHTPRAAPAVAAAPPQPAPVAAAAPASAAVAQPAAPERWRDAANWAAVHRGLNGTQVKAAIGPDGKVMVGVFGDVWYYPDDGGGRVVFDRDGRVSEFDLPPAH